MNTVLGFNPVCSHNNCRHSRALTIRERAFFRERSASTELHFGPAMAVVQFKRILELPAAKVLSEAEGHRSIRPVSFPVGGSGWKRPILARGYRPAQPS